MQPERGGLRAEVKASLALLQESAPGRAVEVRIPPYAAVQAVPGHTHRRGTPSAVVETDAVTWLALARGELTWAEAVAARAASTRAASGPTSARWLPLFTQE